MFFCHRQRKESLAAAQSFEAGGNAPRARRAFYQSLDIKPELVKDVMLHLEEMGVSCTVAPYEADAQLAYMCQLCKCDFVVSEDSDHLAFGCTEVCVQPTRCN